MGVELDPLDADRHREIQRPSRRQHALELAQGQSPPVGIDPIAVPSQADVLDGVEAGERGERVVRDAGQVDQVALLEGEPFHPAFERPDVDHGDRHEGEQVGDEAVDA
jgi:hypothetical protein